VTFPYPYMNGRLHLGHAFSLTKAEFTARFQRLRGKNVLFPFGFHCTGMPIQAAANKLKAEIAAFGCPPVFPVESEEPNEVAPPQEEKSVEASVNAKSKGKKTKLVVKGLTTKTLRQWEIMRMMVPEEQIAEFAEPLKWLEFFPPFGISDLNAFGAAIDWRRSFITTSVNPFYDAFIRWQFNRLKAGGRIKFGKRPNVFSVLDGQVCADHDRASGEGVGPQEYTIIKLRVLDFPESSPLACAALASKRDRIFLGPATLRPETMYGQTNCFVLPEGDYGAYELVNGDIIIVSDRAARGMAHQDILSAPWGTAPCLVTLKGKDLLGLPLSAPNAVYERVYTLPLLSISMGKGTGVVTSVPSDAPDDYAALRELQEKPLYREKFGLTAEMVDPFAVVPIIEIEGYGTASAVVMCDRLNIKSPKDTEKLKIAKDEVYLKGFYEGILLVGECKGMKVCDAKPIIRQSMIDAGTALSYYEPESKVMSRSGDECVVALTDQWYLAYDEADWQNLISSHIHSPAFSAYNDKIMEKFDFVIGWLKEWACCRQFGLGTKLPWDSQFVIESLSDSTVYMAYYTIAHLLQGSAKESLIGANSQIDPAHLTDEVFNYIFLRHDYPADCAISEERLQQMRAEFEYWYPMDLRVSAKDLIPNHLTMCLYNHAEIWKDRPDLWPRSIYCNGHIMVDAEKMSKGRGNFLMMLESVEEFSADATRFALADAGDTMEDANFDRSVANQAIISLFIEEEWIKSVVADAKNGNLRNGDMMFMDSAFMNELDHFIDTTATKFEEMCYRDGIHQCWYEALLVRDLYRDWSTRCNIPMHSAVLSRFIDSVVVMMAPICPHWSENIWTEILGKPTSVCDASWPACSPFDPLMRKKYSFFKEFLKNARQAILKLKQPTQLAEVYLASTYDANKIIVLEYLQTQISASGKFPDDILSKLKEFLASREDLKKETKTLMQFGSFMKAEAEVCGPDILATELSFDQKAILEVSLPFSHSHSPLSHSPLSHSPLSHSPLSHSPLSHSPLFTPCISQENVAFILKTLELEGVQFHNVHQTEALPANADKKKVETALPGKPTFQFSR
jgi:leucyl-tRNA synthetase